MTVPAARLGREWRHLGVLLLVALAVRLPALVTRGHGSDMATFERWAEDLARLGLAGYYDGGGWSNYPAMLYFLWPLGLALDGQPLLTAIRLLSVPFDLALGVVLFFTARGLAGPSAGLVAAALYLLNPGVVLSGTWWGQVDGMGALPMVGAIVAAAGGSVIAAPILATLAGLLKPQFGVAAVVLVGLMLSWLRSREGIRRAALLALTALLTLSAMLLPLSLNPLEYQRIVSRTFALFPMMSFYGFNPWGMLFGFETPDGNAYYVGIGLTLAAIGLSLALLRWRRDLVGLLAIAALIALALYYLPTRVHERYLYGAIVLLAPLAAAFPRLRNPFLLLSGLFFLTIAYVAATSPYRILPLLPPRQAHWEWWGISLLCAAMTAAGAWVAWRLLELFREARTAQPDRSAG